MPSDEEYLLGDSAREVERLQKQHKWVQRSLNDKLIFAPVDPKKPNLTVLDVGAADGTWLRDVQKEVAPTAELVGVDLMKGFLPSSPQGNISFQVGNVNETFPDELQNRFDLTNIRFVLAAAGGKLDQAIENLAATVRSGGFLQVMEMDVEAEEEGRPAFNATLFLIQAIFKQTGIGADMVKRLRPAFEKAGLVDVQVEVATLPAGKPCGSEEDIRNSLDPFKITIPSVIQGARALGAEIPDALVDNLPTRFEQEMLTHGAAYTIYIVTGKKP